MTETQQLVLEKAWENLDCTGAPLLWAWREANAITKPYAGLKIYHNTPLSIETACKIEALSAAGAYVVVSSTDFLVPATFDKALTLVERANLEYREKKHADPNEFDFYLDCCAELSHLPSPNYGVVELTRTGAQIYEKKNNAVPIMSVDNSYLKSLETFNGTGEAFIRAFEKLSNRKVQDEHFAIIGSGKVGRGVAYWIRKNKGTCVIFDVDPIACQRAITDGFDAYPCEENSSSLQALSRASVVVTATGHEDVLNKTFRDATELLSGKVLCNIGAVNEIGSGFRKSEILADGDCINFRLEHPTRMRYLDPSFYAHNLCIQLLLDHAYSPGFHPFPEHLDRLVLERWKTIHQESIECILK